MKTLLCVAALLALVAFPAAAKTCVCHVDNDTGEAHLIWIADSAVPSHVEQHGDCVTYDQTLCEAIVDADDVDDADIPCDPTVGSDSYTCLNN